MSKNEYTSEQQNNQRAEQQYLTQEEQENLCWVLLERERQFHQPVVEVVITYGNVEVRG